MLIPLLKAVDTSDLTKLVLADWLEENERGGIAEGIRFLVQHKKSPLRSRSGCKWMWSYEDYKLRTYSYILPYSWVSKIRSYTYHDYSGSILEAGKSYALLDYTERQKIQDWYSVVHSY